MDRRHAFVISRVKSFLLDLVRLDREAETFLEALFLWSTPFVTALSRSFVAVPSVEITSSGLPAATASCAFTVLKAVLVAVLRASSSRSACAS